MYARKLLLSLMVPVALATGLGACNQTTGATQPGLVNTSAAGGYGGDVTTYEYQEGTLIVDLVESSKKELVWRATIVGTLSGSQEENLKMADTGIAKAFANYPPARKK